MDYQVKIFPKATEVEPFPEAVTFPDSFKSECKIWTTLEDTNEVRVDFDRIDLMTVRSFYEQCIMSNPNFKLQLPVTSNNIANHLDSTSIQFLNSMNYNQIVKINNQKKKSQGTDEEMFEQELKPQIHAWLAGVANTIKLVVFLGFKKMMEVLALSVSVPLYIEVVSQGENKLPNQKSNIVNPYLTPDLYNKMHNKITKELNTIWDAQRRQPQLFNGGWGGLNVQQQPQEQQLAQEPAQNEEFGEF